jgi:hypothetical protein
MVEFSSSGNGNGNGNGKVNLSSREQQQKLIYPNPMIYPVRNGNRGGEVTGPKASLQRDPQRLIKYLKFFILSSFHHSIRFDINIIFRCVVNLQSCDAIMRIMR